MPVSEEQVHNLVLGQPELISPSLAVLENRPYLAGDGGEIDIRCYDLERDEVIYVEIKSCDFNQSFLPQIDRYVSFISKSNAKLLVFAPSYAKDARTELDKRGVTSVQYDLEAIERHIVIQDEARVVLDKLTSALSQQVMTRRKENIRLDLLEALFTTVKIPSGDKMVAKGLKNPTIGTIAGLSKAAACSPWYTSNPALAIKFIYWNFAYPLFVRESKTGVRLAFPAFCEFLEKQTYGGIQPVKQILNHEVLPLVSEFIHAHEEIGDPLLWLARHIVARVTQLPRWGVESRDEVAIGRTIALLKEVLDIRYPYTDLKGGSYDEAMAARALELMFLRGVAIPTMTFTKAPYRLLMFRMIEGQHMFQPVSPGSVNFMMFLRHYRDPQDVGGGCPSLEQ